MGHSQKDKEKNHAEIVAIAAQKMRESGTEGPGVAEIMKAAGLTHGGFYKHFDSRDDLIAEAVDRTFADSQAATAAVIDGADEPLAAFVDWYVSAEHRDNPGTGCSVVALGGEAPRADARVRAAYTDQLRRYLAQLERLLGDPHADADADPDPEARSQATVMLSTLVGAVLVARAVDDPALSDEIIGDVREALTSRRA
jgi:TetR/AcrR family transcriptional repressor of nem operon